VMLEWAFKPLGIFGIWAWNKFQKMGNVFLQNIFVKGQKINHMNEDADSVALDCIRLFYKSGEWKEVTGVEIIAEDYEPNSVFVKAAINEDDPHDSELCEIYLIHPEFGCKMKKFKNEIFDLISQFVDKN